MRLHRRAAERNAVKDGTFSYSTDALRGVIVRFVTLRRRDSFVGAVRVEIQIRFRRAHTDGIDGE
jgi:hypothetical protein